jgi:hypothetical protein
VPHLDRLGTLLLAKPEGAAAGMARKILRDAAQAKETPTQEQVDTRV